MTARVREAASEASAGPVLGLRESPGRRGKAQSLEERILKEPPNCASTRTGVHHALACATPLRNDELHKAFLTPGSLQQAFLPSR